jgi:hypothetical protein
MALQVVRKVLHIFYFTNLMYNIIFCKFRIYSSATFLEKHISVVHASKITNESEEELDEEQRLDRDSSNTFCCCQCFYTFKDMDQLESHTCDLNEGEFKEVINYFTAA